MITMDRSARPPSAQRVPSPWWVLLPGVLLVLVGARAVSAETDRARQDARERARSAALRVARGFETLVDEYLSPLPASDSLVDVDDLEEPTRHLYPTWLVTTAGRWVPIGRFRTAHPSRAVSGDVEQRDAALAAAIFARVESAGDADALAEGPLFAGAAAAVETQWVEGVLRVGAARAELRRGSAEGALWQVERILRLPATVEVPSDSELRPRYPWLAAADVTVDALRLPAGPGGEVVTPDWLLELLDVVAADPWGAPIGRRESVLARIQELMLTDEEQIAFAAIVSARDAVRASCREQSDRSENVIWRPGAYESLAVQRRVVLADSGSQVVAFVGGAIPLATVKARLVDENVAAAEGASAHVVLRSPDGTLAFHHGDDAGTGILEEVILGGVAEGWRLEARVAAPTGLPTSAWLLAGALVLSTAMLGLGSLALTRAAAHHARLAEERRNFLDHVAHEVRTPASAMLALSEELERGHVAPERHATYHEHLVREARRLADLVEETLDLTRLESGRLVAQREPADLRDVVRAAVEAARVDAKQLTIALPGEPVPVDVDVAALRRAVRNLVDNALKHGACDDPVDVRLVVTDGRAILTVRDHGKGIPAEHVERVFERFHRVPSATHEVKGVGLGLALVREVAEAHGGKVSAENAEGGGARFTFSLPTEAPR
jgi:signal transduction histidine kinase